MNEEYDVYGGKSPQKWQEKWVDELTAFEKRARNYRQRGEEVVNRYLSEKQSDDEIGSQKFSLNLFHSNVSTLQSMLYGSTPKNEVSREHNDPDDDIARVASVMFQRMLDADVDSSGDDFPTALKAALQDRLLPGMGVCRVRHSVKTRTEIMFNPETGEEEEIELFDYEEAPVDYVHWGDFAWGWGRTWKEVPWVGFKNYLSKREAESRFGEQEAKNLTYKNQTPDVESDRGRNHDRESESVEQKAEIWEIWCKSSRKVFWIQKGQDKCLDCKDDPLELDGFFPVPKPMIANQVTKEFLPTADFILAQDLYNQIDNLYTRITIITRAIKVVGVYDQAASKSVGRMLQEGLENELIPVDNWAMFAERGGLRGSVDWFPVEDVVNTLQTLRSVLQEQIQLLYQVTGIADIMRGQSDQYTGVGQDQMKAKFGSIRVQALQEEFARFASELQELRAEIFSKHFEPESIIEQSSAQFLPEYDKPLIQPALSLMKSPDIKWRVNIRPESIAMVDYQSLKAERIEYIMAISQYIQSAQAMAKEMPESMPVLLEMMKWGVAGFKGANYLEGILDKAIEDLMKKQEQPQGQQPSPEQVKAQTEQMKAQAMIQKEQIGLQKQREKAQADIAQVQMKLQGELEKIRVDNKADLSVIESERVKELENILAELDADLRLAQNNFENSVGVEEAQAVLDMQINDQEHEHNMREIAASRGKQ